jgi:hypothetical protein
MQATTPLGDLLASPRYLPRLTENDTKPLERALAGATLFDDGVELDGVVVEAAYAVREPEALDHLRDQRVPVLVDPQSLRFSTPAYLINSRLVALPYLPATPLTPASSGSEREHFVADALRFQQKVGAAAYLVPSPPLRDEPGWAELHHDLTARAVAANGREVDSRELVALLAPGASALKSPRDFVSRLLDLPIAAVQVQPLSLDSTKDSVDKLARVWGFCHMIEEAGLPVLAGRVGAFGLVLQALGVSAFESGIGAAERYSWADQVRPPKPKEDEKEGGGGGAGKRIYLGQLLTTLPAKVVDALLRLEGVRGRLVCNLACCRLAGHPGLADRRGEHYLFSRAKEVEQLRAQPTTSLQLHDVHQKLLAARDLASVAKRSLNDLADPDAPAPTFAHLETWLSLLARAEQLKASMASVN